MGLSFDRWTATPAPCLSACETNLHDASIPFSPSIESSTTNTVQLTGSLDSGLSNHDWARPVRDISSAVIRLNLLDTEGEEYKYGKKEIKKDLKSQEFPFYTKPKKKKKSDIENYSDFEKLLIEVSEKVSAPKKKPTKYTKEGLFDAMSVVGMIPGTQAYTLDKLTKQQEDKKFQRKRKYVEGYTDIATQLMKGTGNFVQSASEWVLTPIDWAFSTEFQDKFNKAMDKSLFLETITL